MSFSLREQKTKKALLEREISQKHRLYEISILKEIQDQIGYELDVEKVIDVVTGSIKNLFAYSTASSLVIKEDRLIFKVHLEEVVNSIFIERVKQSMLASLAQLSNSPLPKKIDVNISGVPLDYASVTSPSSFFHIPLIVSNNVVGLISIASDTPNLYKEDEMTVLYQITEQASKALTKLQDLLKTEKGKLTAMIQSLTDGIIMFDANNQLLVINPAAKRLLKIEKNSPNILDVMTAFPKENNIADKIKNSLAKNTTEEIKEIQVDGKSINASIIPVVDPKTAKVFGTSVLIRDITLEKNLLQMKEDFTNIVVHELRAPLTAIKGAASLMKDPSNIQEEEQINLIKLINNQSKKLLDEVSSILDAAKLEEGKFTIYKQPNDLKKVINDTLEVFTHQAQENNITLIAETGNIPAFPFDAQKISQVINNLLSNSLKFTLGGGKIIVKAVLSSQENVTVSVSDTGVGIPKNKQEILFAKFSQVAYPQSDFKYLTTGTGLGLYIVKGIVEAHGGSVSLQSEVGKGTIVSFTLPTT